MKSRAIALIVFVSFMAAGCDLLTGKGKDSSSSGSSAPTSPTTPSVSLDAFAGTWTSVSASTPATGCGNVKYTVTPTTSSSANVSFTATCASNISVTGAGAGTLSGSAINWSATGLVSQGGVNCPFTFPSNKSTLGADNQIVVTYAGTVCGIPVSGSETVRK
jgi:predicted small secreted protein